MNAIRRPLGLLSVLAAATLVAPLRAQVPRPADVFGFEPGADYHLATYEQVQAYFHRLDAASDRIKVVEIGKSTLGKPMLLAFISSEENLRQLDHWRSISERLALANDLTDVEARQLADEGKAIVWIDGGLHASEVAHGQETPLIAYDMVTDDSPEARRIRDNVVLLLMPNMNPDGLDIVASWYARNLGSPFETASLPWLYHHDVGHDNNRDWFTMFMPESRAVANQLYHVWYPQIVYNQHQSGPFPSRIFTPPFADPVNPNIPPLVVRETNLVGDAMNKRFAEEHKAGVVSRTGFDMWWNGGMRTAPYYHNQVGILTETALYEYATPHYYEPDSLPATIRGSTLSAKTPSVFYPNPWKGGWWRLRDAVDYMVTSDYAVLDVAADKRDEFLYNAYRMGRDAIDKGKAGGPFAYVIPADSQWNPREAVELVNMLRRAGIEVQRATLPFQAAGRSFAAGSFVVPAAQAFRPYVIDLFEKQVYPDMRLYPGGPPEPPYDISGWTLPIQMDVGVARVEKPFQLAAEAVGDSAVVAAGSVTGTGRWGYLLSHRPNAAAIAVNRLLAAGEKVGWVMRPTSAGGRSWPAGTIAVQARGGTGDRIGALARSLGVDFVGVDAAPAGLQPLSTPRVALYKSWVANIDEGWTRWILQQYDFPVDTLHDADVRGGALQRYDVLILPDQSAGALLNGHATGTMPAEYVGGLGVEGAAAIDRFVRAGGLLLTLDAASDFAIEQLGLPVRDATQGLESSRFFIPGTLIRITVDASEPIAFGMPDEAAAFFSRSRAFSIVAPAAEGDKKAAPQPVDVIARYATEDLLLSGWALGEKRYIAGQPAAVRVRHGKGDVVLIGFRPQFRAQPRGTFKLLFNALHAATVPDLPAPGATAVSESPQPSR